MKNSVRTWATASSADVLCCRAGYGSCLVRGRRRSDVCLRLAIADFPGAGQMNCGLAGFALATEISKRPESPSPVFGVLKRRPRLQHRQLRGLPQATNSSMDCGAVRCEETIDAVMTTDHRRIATSWAKRLCSRLAIERAMRTAGLACRLRTATARIGLMRVRMARWAVDCHAGRLARRVARRHSLR